MHARVASRFTARRLGVIGAALLAGTAWPSLAQTQASDTPAAAQDQSVPEAEQSIVVTGYRASLQSSTNAKKNKAEADQKDMDTISAAKACRGEQTKDSAMFKTTYKNFGTCVSKKAHELNAQRQQSQ